MKRLIAHRALQSWVRLIAAVAFVFLCTGANGPKAQEFSGDAARGKSVFAAKGCFECHGLDARGSIATGPALAPARLPFAAFDVYVRAPAGTMPPYLKGQLPDSEVRDIFAYLASLPSSRSAANIPLLSPFVMPPAKRSAVSRNIRTTQ